MKKKEKRTGCLIKLLLPYYVKEVLPGIKEQKRIHGGLISESLPNGILQIPLDNEDLILGYVSGGIRSSFIRILPWDRVNKSEGSAYDSTKGRIIYRLRNKDSND